MIRARWVTEGLVTALVDDDGLELGIVLYFPIPTESYWAITSRGKSDSVGHLRDLDTAKLALISMLAAQGVDVYIVSEDDAARDR